MSSDATSRRQDRGGRRRRSDLAIEGLEDRRLLSSILVQGAGKGQAPVVRVLDAATGTQTLSFLAYDASMKSGVRVAVGDVDGDGVQDVITATGPGGPGLVRVFRSTDGALEGSFAVSGSNRGGYWVAAGDVENTGTADIVVTPGLGSPLIQVFRGTTGQLVESIQANAGLPARAWQGAKVAVGDLDRDGFANIVAVPGTGQPIVRVFGQAGKLVSSYRALPRAVAGGLSVTVGNVASAQRMDVAIASAAGKAARVRIFQGTTSTVAADFKVAGPFATGSGVQVAAVGVDSQTGDELALSTARPHTKPQSTVVVSTQSLRLGAVLPSLASLLPAPGVAYRTAAIPAGAFVAGSGTVANSTPAVAVANGISSTSSPSLTPLQRLAIFDPLSKTFQPVVQNDPRLVGKDISVLVHGWAPGYVNWVDAEAAKGLTLKWWWTFPGQPGFDPPKTNPGPASAWLLDGGPSGNEAAALTGMAQDILGRTSATGGAPADPNAVVLAYTWIDDSATPSWDLDGVHVPQDANLSEARTALNGERLAAGLESALGSASAASSAKIQLIGHSHGSKVATVAAVELARAGYPLRQLTLLDSPEDSDTAGGQAVVSMGAANFNWFFLQDLGLNRQSTSAPFVDAYASYFGYAFGGTTSDGTVTLSSSLNQVVDVSLYPDSLSETDIADRHAYAAWWYTGSGEPSLNGGTASNVGQYWSPLLPGSGGVSALARYYEQNWSVLSYPADQQFVLNAEGSPPAQNFTFRSAGVGGVSLRQSSSVIQSQTVSIDAPYDGFAGISFNYDFSSFKPGDLLTILADGTEAFVMDPTVSGTGTRPATISLSSLPFGSHTLTFILTSATANSTSAVTISNVNTFERNVI
ncbi:FG-GAP repeat domain-containing protein [Aquisphaera insulae]|uniref:FG-GAP repeat domain-containing protein n=1 Tax=Aquisphaera insulae TaxID=2712864 RepID=UPI0013ED7CAE|nr:VCBS repeat-containing protein [Aquisphaera insulae]